MSIASTANCWFARWRKLSMAVDGDAGYGPDIIFSKSRIPGPAGAFSGCCRPRSPRGASQGDQGEFLDASPAGGGSGPAWHPASSRSAGQSACRCLAAPGMRRFSKFLLSPPCSRDLCGREATGFWSAYFSQARLETAFELRWAEVRPPESSERRVGSKRCPCTFFIALCRFKLCLSAVSGGRADPCFFRDCQKILFREPMISV